MAGQRGAAWERKATCMTKGKEEDVDWRKIGSSDQISESLTEISETNLEKKRGGGKERESISEGKKIGRGRGPEGEENSSAKSRPRCSHTLPAGKPPTRSGMGHHHQSPVSKRGSRFSRGKKTARRKGRVLVAHAVNRPKASGSLAHIASIEIRHEFAEPGAAELKFDGGAELDREREK